jgi:hypothetical protein
VNAAALKAAIAESRATRTRIESHYAGELMQLLGAGRRREIGGDLAQRVEQKGGHTFTRFYGRPSSWMNAFAPQGKLVRRIKRMDDHGNVTDALYQRAK